MSLEADEVAVGATGNIWRGAVGTAFPANISAAVNETLWTDLGYTTEDGCQFTFGREVNPVNAWQSYDPIRLINARIPKSMKHDFLQFNQNTWATAMGGGTWSGTDPNFEYQPPDESDVDIFAEIIEFRDGDYTYRFCFYRVQNQSGVEFSTTRDNPVTLPVEVVVLSSGQSGVKPFIFQTNDPNLGDVTEAGS